MQFVAAVICVLIACTVVDHVICAVIKQSKYSTEQVGLHRLVRSAVRRSKSVIFPEEPPITWSNGSKTYTIEQRYMEMVAEKRGLAPLS